MTNGDPIAASQKRQQWEGLGQDLLNEMRRRFSNEPRLLEQFVFISETQGYLEDKLLPIQKDSEADTSLTLSRFSIFFENSGNIALRKSAELPGDSSLHNAIMSFYNIARVLDPFSLGSWVGLVVFHNGTGNNAEARRCLNILKDRYGRIMASVPEDLGTHQRSMVEMERDPKIREFYSQQGFDMPPGSYKDLINSLEELMEDKRIVLRCAGCGQQLRLPESPKGKSIRCPSCKRPLTSDPA